MSGDTVEEFGDYQLTHLLGKGGMASVYRGLRSGPMGFAKQVAIKRLHPSLTQDEDILKALINEARLGGQLKHLNIVEVYEFNRVEDTYYIAMEFVDGWTLDRIIQLSRTFERPLPLGVVGAILDQVCSGLSYAHNLSTLDGQETRLVHRDLKPANIIISREGVAKIMDFGIAKADTNLFKTTMADVTKGTPHYMSPEQVAGDPNLGPRSDIFALGTVLFELITGRLLFRGSSLASVLFAVARANVSGPLTQITGSAEPLVPILERCLQKLPADRYPDVDALQADLRSSLPKPEGRPAITRYVYDLRSQMVIDQQELSEIDTRLENEPEFATLLQSDWLKAERYKAEEMDRAREAAEAEISAQLKRTAKKKPVDIRATTVHTSSLGPDGSTALSAPGKTKRDTDFDAAVVSTRVFGPEGRGAGRSTWIGVALALLLVVGGVSASLLRSPKPAAQSEAAGEGPGESEGLKDGADAEASTDGVADGQGDASTPAPPDKSSKRQRKAGAQQPSPKPKTGGGAAPAASPRKEASVPTPAPPEPAVARTAAATATPAPTAAPVPAPTQPPAEAVQALEPGLLVIRKTTPYAVIWIDGQKTAHKTPTFRPIPVPAGTHTLKLDCVTKQTSVSRQIVVEPGKTTVVPGYNFEAGSWNP